MSFKVYYRVSDKGNLANKPSYVNLKNCLENFLNHFSKDEITIIADNVDESTIEYLKSLSLDNIYRTSTGNSLGFIETLKKSIHENDDSTTVYLVEDDYIHMRGSKEIIEEGLEIADYVTLYDNPDKYRDDGPNPHIQDGGEITKVFVSNSSHWKLTNSTCMTFAGKVCTLKKDFKVMSRYCAKGDIPNDFKMWTKLVRKRGRKLISPIPGYATHGMSQYLAPLLDWEREINHKK